MQNRTFLRLGISWLLVWATAEAVGVAADDALDAEAARAVERGIEFLKTQQNEDGSWSAQSDRAGGVTALCAAALLQAGVKPEDAVIQKALASLRQVEPTFSYSVALQTMVFCAASPEKDTALIRRNVAWLEKAQVTDGKMRGGWSYVLNHAGRGDSSCSRFAVLGLHAAKKAGFDVSADTWRRVSDYWLTTQTANGLWSYTPEAQPTPTMTLAGVAGLATVNRYLPQDEQTKLREAAIRKASERLDKAMPHLRNSTFAFYSFHSLEQAGHIAGVVQFGDLDWKAEGTKWLLDTQRPDGSWLGRAGGFVGSGPLENENIATSFALMFLTGRSEVLQNNANPPERK